jgi:hypothetical protein
MADRSGRAVYGVGLRGSLAGIAGSNPTGDMDVSLMCQVDVSVLGLSLAVTSPTVAPTCSILCSYTWPLTSWPLGTHIASSLPIELTACLNKEAKFNIFEQCRSSTSQL